MASRTLNKPKTIGPSLSRADITDAERYRLAVKFDPKKIDLNEIWMACFLEREQYKVPRQRNGRGFIPAEESKSGWHAFIEVVFHKKQNPSLGTVTMRLVDGALKKPPVPGAKVMPQYVVADHIAGMHNVAREIERKNFGRVRSKIEREIDPIIIDRTYPVPGNNI